MNEQPVLQLLRFTAFAALPDAQMHLADGALLVAEIAHPSLDRGAVLRRLDALAASVRAELQMTADTMLPADALGQRSTAERVLQTLARVLHTHEGFDGAHATPNDPGNSFLDDVLERRTGLPITLSIVYIEVARRIGAPLVGVGLPGHFMAKWPLPASEGGDIFIDAFGGGELRDVGACRRFVLRLATRDETVEQIFNPAWLEPVSVRVIITRMLHNLKELYLQRGETQNALAVVDRLVALRPDLPGEQRDRGLLRLALGEPLLAAADIAAYTARVPTAPESKRLARRLAAVSELRAKRN